MPDTVIKTAASPIVATARLKLSIATPLVLPATPATAVGYTIDIGEHPFTIKVGGDLKELWSASGGTLGKFKKRRVKPTLSYECDLQFLPPTLLGYYMGTADTGGAPNPGKVIEAYGWIGFSAEDEAVFNDLGITIHHSFICAITVDGDFEAKGEDFASLKLTAEVLLGRAKGTVSFAARPVAQT